MSVRWTLLLLGLCALGPNAFSDEPRPLEARLLDEDRAKLVAAVEREGDAARGAIVFHRRASACIRCHSTGTGRSPLGPDLTAKSPRMTTAHVVESILAPSKAIEQKYRAVQVVTDEGRVVVGLLQEETPQVVRVIVPHESGKVTEIPRKEVDDILVSDVSLMPAGLVNPLANRGEFLDLCRYVVEIAAGGPDRARALQPDPSLLQPIDDGPIDHRAAIAALADLDPDAGRDLYARHCISCHGADGNKTLNPLARRFAKDPLKFGIDPYAMWRTISHGNGLMFPQAALLTPEEQYRVVHYIRERFIRDANPTQYHRPDETYLAKVNAIAAEDAKKFATAEIVIAEGMIDGRMGRHMQYGTSLAHSVAFGDSPERTTERALLVAPFGEHVLCYDTERGSVAGLWRGSLADTSKTHHTSHKGNTCLRPGGAVTYADVDAVGWSLVDPRKSPPDVAAYSFRGHFRHGRQVLLAHTVGSARILELPGFHPTSESTHTRSFRITAAEGVVFALVGRLPDGRITIDGDRARLSSKDHELRAKVTGDTAGLRFLDDTTGGLWLAIPATDSARSFTLWFSPDDELLVPDDPATPDLEALTTGGPRVWRKTVRTKGVLGEAVNGYAADELTLPVANPFGSWMRTTAIDFLSDGTAVVATLSGDVWFARWSDPELSDITWSRFAAGLYEPLGLRVVDDTIYVRGRDRITRLHDRNGDGEADHYESFHTDAIIGSGYHAFLFDLQTDAAGNFYYAKSGRKSPHEGGVIRVSPDGTRADHICHDFRHPNGMGAGGPYDWVTVTDNPSGAALFNGVALVREGGFYGYESPRTVPMLAVLPARVDSSSGGQCWADPKRWGPLSGAMIHTSYSRCAAFAIHVDDVQPHPNGFALRMPFDLKSGVMRTRVNPVDGQVYVVGQKGWDTIAKHDGCLYRIRHVAGPTRLVTAAEATPRGVRLTFSCDLDPATVRPANVEVVREGDKQTQPVALGDVLRVDANAIEVVLPEIEHETVSERTGVDRKTGRATVTVLAPIRITVRMRTPGGEAVEQTVWATINSLPQESSDPK